MRILLSISILFSISASAQQWNQLGQTLLGEYGGDLFGTSVDINEDGNTIAAGAYFNDGNGSGSGHVRVFEYDGISWNQKGNDIDGEAAADNSGISVALSDDGNTIAIGAYGNAGTGAYQGHVRVYQWNGTAWVQKGGDIDGEADNDYSGAAIDISANGNLVAIGSYKSNAGAFDSGQTRIFEWGGSAWVQKGASINGLAFGDQSGFSVSMSDNGLTVAIGELNSDVVGPDAGQARVFQWSGSAWMQKGATLLGEATGDLFGFDVSLAADGNTLAVGAKKNDGNGAEAGHVRVFEWSGSAWAQKGADIDGEAIGDNFGVSVALNESGDTLVAGADRNNNFGAQRGHARVYVWSGSAWAQWGNDFDGVADYDWFGIATAISPDGETIVISGYGNDESGTDAGHVKVYRYCPNNIDPTVTQSGTTLTATASGYMYQWVDCDDNYAPITGETSQSFTYTSYGNYAVLIDDGSCPILSNCVLIDGAGLNDIESGFKVFPNPSNGQFTIQTMADEPCRITIVDITGEEVFNADYSNQSSIEIDLNESPGVYFLYLTTESGKAFKKRLAIFQ